MFRKLTLLTAVALIASTVTVQQMFGKGKSSNRFVDTDDYKKGEYDKGVIEDYSNLVEGDGVEWVYVAPGIHLADYKVKVGTFKNKSDVTSNSMMKSFEQTLSESLERKGSKGAKGTLSAEGAVYWAERSSQGKRWIPYAGGHLAQAGVGAEVILRDAKGDIVAEFRHSGREGDRLESAAEEVADDIAGYISDH
ncbi:MAG: hypothetical protein ABI718_04355 [Acidobacteriota bacterium]